MHARIVNHTNTIDIRMRLENRVRSGSEIAHLDRGLTDRPRQPLRYPAGHSQTGKGTRARTERNGIHIGHLEVLATEYLIGKRDQAFGMTVFLFKNATDDFAVGQQCSAGIVTARFNS